MSNPNQKGYNPPYAQPKPCKDPMGPQADVGYPATGVKTDGIKQRGSGCAQKGFTSRGPMA